MKDLRDTPLRYRLAGSFLFGGISLFLFCVVFALARQAAHAAENQAWAWVVIIALIALIAAVALFSALVAWGALSDPKSRLGFLVQKRFSLAHAVQHFLGEAAMVVLLLIVLCVLGIKF